jgi:hypothetical protein
MDPDVDLSTTLGIGGGGGSAVDLMELRLVELRKLGGDFIENPERVLQLAFLGAAISVYPPPGAPLCGAVRGRSMASSRCRGTFGGGATLEFRDCRLESFRALDR